VRGGTRNHEPEVPATAMVTRYDERLLSKTKVSYTSTFAVKRQAG
jgi:hypothetical protein